MQRDLAQTLSSGTAGGQLLEEVPGGAVTSDTAVDDTAQQEGTTKTVGTVDTTSKLTAGVEVLEWLMLGVKNLSVFVDLNTTRGEVEDGLHQGNVEGVIDVEGHVVKETLVEGALPLALNFLFTSGQS